MHIACLGVLFPNVLTLLSVKQYFTLPQPHCYQPPPQDCPVQLELIQPLLIV